LGTVRAGADAAGAGGAGGAPGVPGARLADLARRPDVPVAAIASALRAAGVDAPDALVDRVVTDIRYEGYVVRQRAEIRRHAEGERSPIPATLDPDAIVGLRAEARETLRRFRPATLGQAGRLAGISPADVSLIAIAAKRARAGAAERPG
jgi:tRNA uridine 5-carboxymethylaminomethyl modification enzyme